MMILDAVEDYKDWIVSGRTLRHKNDLTRMHPTLCSPFTDGLCAVATTDYLTIGFEGDVTSVSMDLGSKFPLRDITIDQLYKRIQIRTPIHVTNLYITNGCIVGCIRSAAYMIFVLERAGDVIRLRSCIRVIPGCVMYPNREIVLEYGGYIEHYDLDCNLIGTLPSQSCHHIETMQCNLQSGNISPYIIIFVRYETTRFAKIYSDGVLLGMTQLDFVMTHTYDIVGIECNYKTDNKNNVIRFLSDEKLYTYRVQYGS